MATRVYSAHDTSISLTASAAESCEAVIEVQSDNVYKFLSLDISGDFDDASDNPVLCRLARVTGTASGTSVTPGSHNTGHGLASGATVTMDSVTGMSEVSNSQVFAKRVRPGQSWKPGVTMQPGEKWAVFMTPGAQNRNMDLSLFWEE